MDLEAFVQEQTKLKKKHTMEREDEEDQADKTEAEELERLRQVSLKPVFHLGIFFAPTRKKRM